jgi:hypothetical protein
MHDDDLIDLLGGLDPVGADDAPAPGSTRYRQILERAMTTATDHTTDHTGQHDAGTDVASPDRPGSPRPRLPRLLAAAAVLAVIAIGATTLLPGSAPSAEAQLRSAAETLGDVDSLRATLTTTEPDGTVRTSTAEFSGADATIVDRYVPDGASEEVTFGFTVLGDTIYEFDGSGLTSSTAVGPNDRLTPFADASAQVLDAALTGADITELAATELDGVSVDRYLLTLTAASRAALDRLTPAELAWFELEYPDDVRTIEVWVADDLIRGITVTGNLVGVRDLRYFDFNEPITIVAPER